MPFKSLKQSKACFASNGFGNKVDCDEWAKATNYKTLKNMGGKLRGKKMATGGDFAPAAGPGDDQSGQIPDVGAPKTPINLQNLGIALQAGTTGLSWLSNIIDRHRQNQYDYQQQSTLAQINPMPANDYQPNPYNLYAKMGGNLKTIQNHINMLRKGGKYQGHPTQRKHVMKKLVKDVDKDGDRINDMDGDEMKKGGNWLKGAINPAHKGWCTPLSNPHCTGHRRAFALMMKKKHGFHG